MPPHQASSSDARKSAYQGFVETTYRNSKQLNLLATFLPKMIDNAAKDSMMRLISMMEVEHMSRGVRRRGLKHSGGSC